MVERTLETQVRKYLKKFPVVTVTGTRQCGKSTLLKSVFTDYRYESLEAPDVREFAKNDPRGFLKECGHKCIIDEAQWVPELFSYIQTFVDESGGMGEYILSGSHNFLLMDSVSQSLAGRTAVLKLAPFSMAELNSAELLEDNVDELMFKGFYPAIYSRDIEPQDYFPSYVQTYIERDVRLIRNIPSTADFIKFVRLVAARSAQALNLNELSNVAGISVPTVRAWLSILEQSYIIFKLPPYYNNYTKRLTKTSKIYLYDTGLLCYLLGIEDEAQLNSHPSKGAIFETMVVSEFVKCRIFEGKEPNCYYWRDSNRNEVDLLAERGGKLYAYEIKAASTMDKKYMTQLEKFGALAGLESDCLTCIYTGDRDARTSYGNYVKYDRVFSVR